MSKFTKALKILWHGTKVILHLTDNKEKLEKMNEIEKKVNK